MNIIRVINIDCSIAIDTKFTTFFTQSIKLYIQKISLINEQKTINVSKKLAPTSIKRVQIRLIVNLNFFMQAITVAIKIIMALPSNHDFFKIRIIQFGRI